ncbi:MAG: BtpA/SgcQ family protein [Phycisphaerae bacterium]|nr:BtpA/SgcQ family protein [Phycisphaerae bacterium]
MSASEHTVSLFGRHRALVGMVHVRALPGTSRASESVAAIAAHARAEAVALAEAGFDAIILENMHDVPYLRRDVGPEIVAAMTRVACAVREAAGIPIGVQVLAGANHAALAIALAADLQFVRAEGFVFASVADEGLIADADAGPLLRYRRAIGADHIAVIADVKKKHSAHAITADISVAENAAAAEFFGASAIVMTGAATGQPTAIGDLDAARRGCGIPIVVGSGATSATVATLLDHADAVIVGSDTKRGGRWDNPIDPARVRAFIEAARANR